MSYAEGKSNQQTGCFYAMVFLRDGFGNYTVRAARTKPFKTMQQAKAQVEKVGHNATNGACGGYVKQLGNPVPVWQNVEPCQPPQRTS